MADSEPPPEYLDNKEIRDLLLGLSPAEHLRLRKIATRYAEGTKMNAEDLVQETHLKFLSGERKCPRQHNFTTVFVNAMRSIAWASREQASSDPIFQATELQKSEDKVASPHNPEQAILEKRGYKDLQQSLLDQFEGDEEAQLVLLAIFSESEPAMICEDLGINATTYATVRRRIRRTLDKTFPDGWTK